ncbi:uncharacterized protein LOC110735112 [Chenopodium quinoa]|uniref:Uncharacterized protein n=1 Tax=Chenopodium quinoa TaxID=63459 RepID=A0A803LSJ4_CHEQI|nr:uncharacterized protein LOC110735112 [Chenopodium quinoa]
MAKSSEAMPLKELNTTTLGFESPPSLKHYQKIEGTQNSAKKNEDTQNSMQKTEYVQNLRNYTDDSCKCKVSTGLGTPDRLKLPKPFKYPERYTSPTDNILSPISKGLLGRKSRRGGALLPPSIIRSKIQELRSPDVEQCQLNMKQ